MATLHQQQPAGLEPVGAELGQVERIGAGPKAEQVEGGAGRAGGPKAEQLERSGAKWNKSKPNRKRSKAGPKAEPVEKLEQSGPAGRRWSSWSGSGRGGRLELEPVGRPASWAGAGQPPLYSILPQWE